MTASGSAAHALPDEIWRIVIRYSTHTDYKLSSSDGRSVAFESSVSAPSCLKYRRALTPSLYRDNQNQYVPQTTMETINNIVTKRRISLVCRTFNRIVSEFLYEMLYVSNATQARRLADALGAPATGFPRGQWVRHFTVVGNFFSAPSSSTGLSQQVQRILRLAINLQSFHISWKSLSMELRATEEEIINAVPGHNLRHLEWHSSSCSWDHKPSHAFFGLLSRAKDTLRVLTLQGTLPLAESTPPVHQQAGLIDLPALTHLSVRRAYRDDLALITPWRISTQLTCLDLGSVWSYFDGRESDSAFWLAEKPALRCLHLGEDFDLSPVLAQRIVQCCSGLRALEYAFPRVGAPDIWDGLDHATLESVVLHTAHATIAARSVFNSRMAATDRATRDELLERLLRHLRPFYDVAPHVAEEGAGTAFGALGKISIVEYMHKPDQLQYEPEELVQWLNGEIMKVQKRPELDFSAELARYMC